jgi:hypothetical protein
MEADSTARHSLLGRFQRVCYLVLGGARTHHPSLVSWPAAMTKVPGQARGPWTPVITYRLWERALEDRIVYLQPGHLAVRPAATDRLATGSGSARCAHHAGVGILHSWRPSRLRSVVEDLRARGVGPHHVGCIYEILLGLVGLADKEHFAVAGHDPAVELPVDGLMDLELDHGGWFSSSWVPGGAHQRRVIRGRRAVCSQPDLITVIILMSKFGTYRIRRPIRRYAPTDPRSTATCRPEPTLVPGRLLPLGLANRANPWIASVGITAPRAPARRLAASSPTASRRPVQFGVHRYLPLGWQPSRFLVDRGEAERAFQLAERLGSVNAAAKELGTPGRRCARPLPATALGCPHGTLRPSDSGPSPAARQRTERLANPSLDPAFAALNPGALPPGTVIGRAACVVRREEQYAILAANVVVKLYVKPRLPAHPSGLVDHPPGRLRPLSSPRPRTAWRPPPHRPHPPRRTAPADPPSPGAGMVADAL